MRKTGFPSAAAASAAVFALALEVLLAPPVGAAVGVPALSDMAGELIFPLGKIARNDVGALAGL